MKKTLFFMLVAVSVLYLNSCSTATQVYSIRGKYPHENSVITKTSFDDVWDNVIDYFAENSIPIEVVSKESGLIVSKENFFENGVATCENENGELMSHNASFVVAYRPNSVGARVSCAFNVRVKKINDNETFIQINLSNIKGYRYMSYVNPISREVVLTQYAEECKSTGLFEKYLLKLFGEILDL